MFKEFHALLFGKDETKLDEYLGKHGASEIESFCNGIKKDITPVKNAISLSVNSGFVEGNNNFIKVLKRIAFGFRSFRRFKVRIMICKNLLHMKKANTF